MHLAIVQLDLTCGSIDQAGVIGVPEGFKLHDLKSSPQMSCRRGLLERRNLPSVMEQYLRVVFIDRPWGSMYSGNTTDPIRRMLRRALPTSSTTPGSFVLSDYSLVATFCSCSCTCDTTTPCQIFQST